MISRRNLAIAAVALLAIAVGLQRLSNAAAGLAVSHATVGATPVTVFRPSDAGDAGPVVVIAHGFAGSQQLMQPFAVTLARNGFTAVTFDFLGHGRHPLALSGSISEERGATAALVTQAAEVMAFAKGLAPKANGIALLGHSMASDVVVRAAQADASVRATVAVSMFSPVVTPSSPRNLLVIVGALEPEALKAEGRRVVEMVSAAPPKDGVTYGKFDEGTARRVSFAAGVEHVSVLYSRDGLREALDWLNAAFERPPAHGDAFLDTRGASLGLLLLGLIALARPLSQLLPVAASQPAGAGLTWRALAPVAIAPAVLTPLLLWKAPTDFLPILVGDYLAVHFAVYGLLTAAGLWIIRRETPSAVPAAPVNVVALASAAAAIALYSIVAIGQPLDAYVANFTPAPQRYLLVAAMFAGMLPYFLADEWATRGAGAARGGYAMTKICFLISLAIAVALNLEKLFFLIIIVPVILIFFLIYGLFSGWAYQRTGHPFAGAIANAVAFAWALAVTFPVLAR